MAIILTFIYLYFNLSNVAVLLSLLSILFIAQEVQSQRTVIGGPYDYKTFTPLP